jgi:hypothetical protein
MIHSMLLSILKTQCTAGVICDWMIMECTYDKYCNMPLTLGTFNSWAGVAAQEYAIRYPGQHHPDANVFRQLEQHLHDVGSVMPMAHMDCMDMSHWRCLNYSCGMTATGKLTQYHTVIGTVQTEGHWSTSQRSVASISLLMEHTSVSRQLSSMDAILQMVVTSTHCGWALFT